MSDIRYDPTIASAMYQKADQRPQAFQTVFRKLGGSGERLHNAGKETR